MRIVIDLAGYAALRERVGAAVAAADPLGLLAMGCPPEEYAPEVVQIIPHVDRAESIEALRTKVHEVFVSMFDADIAGPPESYTGLAGALWALRSPGAGA
jgi:hypothetical protein